MDFLLSVISLFNPEHTLQNSQQTRQNTTQQVNHTSKLHSSHTQDKSFQSCLRESQFEITRTEPIDSNFSAFFQLIKTQSTTLPYFGVLIGVISREIGFQKTLDENTIIRIGKSQQINSVGALRKNALDALLVYYDESGCQFELYQIFLAQQRLIFVVQSEGVLKTILSKLQTVVSQLFADQPLSQSYLNLCIEIIKYENKYFVQFKEGSYFCNFLNNELKKIKLYLQNQQWYQLLIKKITLKDYLDFRLAVPSVKAKILSIQKEIKSQLQNSRKKQQELKFAKSVVHVSENEQQKPEIKPIRKNSSFEADIEAEYFKIRASEKKTGETQIQEQIDTADLFYLIQQRDNSCNSDKSEEKSPKIVLKNRPARDTTKRKRSKSEHFNEITLNENLDEQFFTKQ